MKWEIESFTPSDGSKQAFVTVDHQACLKGKSEDRTVTVLLNMSSQGVSEENARAMLEAMVAGLNAMPSTPPTR